MDVIVEPVGGRQHQPEDFNGIVNQSFRSEDEDQESRGQDDGEPEQEDGADEGEDDEARALPDGGGEDGGLASRAARRREALRRRKNTRWALCMYILPAALVLLGLMVAIIVLQVVYFLEGEELDKVKGRLDTTGTHAMTTTRPWPPSSPMPTTYPTRPVGPVVPSSTVPPETRVIGDKKPDSPAGPGPISAFPSYEPPEGIPGNGDDGNGEGEGEGPEEPTGPKTQRNAPPEPAMPGPPVDGPQPPAPRPPGGQAQDPVDSGPGVQGHAPAPGNASEPSEPQNDPSKGMHPLPPPEEVGPLGAVPTTPRRTTPPYRGAPSTSSTESATSSSTSQTPSLAPSTTTPMDDAEVKSIENRQESLRQILIWLILILFAVGIVLIVGAFAIYKGWCCKYDLQGKYERSTCLGFLCCCCDGAENYTSSSSRRNSPQEIVHMSELQRRSSEQDQNEVAASDAEITEDEREISDDESDGRNRSNRRRITRPRRHQDRTTGEVTQIFIIPQGFEPPPSYEESVGIHGGPAEGDQGHLHGNNNVEVARHDSNRSVVVSTAGSHVSRLNTLPTYEDSVASSEITINPQQLSQLTQGGSIPMHTRARVFMLRSENRSHTFAVPRYTARPEIPSNLVGRDYINVARATRSPPPVPRRPRRSPHRNRRANNENADHRDEDRSNRSTPRSTPRSARRRDIDSSRRNISDTTEGESTQETSQSSPVHSERSRNPRQRNQRDNRSPNVQGRPRRSPVTGSRHSPSSRREITRRGSDSSTDTDNQINGPPRPPRYTPYAPISGANLRSTRVVDNTTTSDTTDSHESFTIPSSSRDTNQVQVVVNSSTTLGSDPNANHANVITVPGNVVSFSQPEPQAELPQVTSVSNQPPPSAAVTTQATITTTAPVSTSQTPRSHNYQRGVSSASEMSSSEQYRFSRTSRESDTFSTDSLESVGCGVTIVHYSPSATNMPPPANMTDVGAVPSHRRLPSSHSNSSGLSTTNLETIAMPTSNATNGSPRRLSRASQAASSLEEIQPIRTSNASTGNGSVSARTQDLASGSSHQRSQEATPDSNPTSSRQISSPVKSTTDATSATRRAPGEWVTCVPSSPDSSPVPATRTPANQNLSQVSEPNRTIVSVEPPQPDTVSLGTQSSGSRRTYAADSVSLGGQSLGTRLSERNSISGYSAHYDAVTLSSVVYVTSDNASLSDNNSIGS